MPKATATSTPIKKEKKSKEGYNPDGLELEARTEAMKAYLTGQSQITREYNQFNGRNLQDSIDDWTKRWNGFVPPANPLLDSDQSRMFLNFTRNQVISYLAKVALARVKSKIKAVNKKSGMVDQRVSSVLEDLNDFSLDNENGDARYLEAAFECCVKGTVIVYEGYKRQTQKIKSPVEFNVETGELEWKEEDQIVFDDCYQEVVPLEDFYIANPYQSDIQKQPFVMWRQVTTYDEANTAYGHYKNWQYVKRGGGPASGISGDPTTFYRSHINTDLNDDQIEIVRFYNRSKNLHVVLANGVVLYQGPIPFRDGRYPFAKGIFEPFDNNFFWGMGFPNKIMGEQDLMNTFWNMMADKTFGSLLPYGLSSDLDDLIEDDILQPNKIRKVGDINKWKFDSLPGVNSGEQAMMQMAINFARENSGDMTGAGMASTPKGGKITARQALLQQQESMQRLGFSMNFLEDMERDRTILRVNHIIQFYSVPKIEKVAGPGTDVLETLKYRDVRLNNVTLSDGQTGNKVIKLTGQVTNPDERMKMADHLSVIESLGEQQGTPTEALAVDVNTFFNYNMEVQVVKRSSYERNKALEQAERHEYANWRLSATQFGVGVNAQELVHWVDESYDIDSERFDAPAPAPVAPPGASNAAPAVAGASAPAPAAPAPKMPDSMGGEL